MNRVVTTDCIVLGAIILTEYLYTLKLYNSVFPHYHLDTNDDGATSITMLMMTVTMTMTNTITFVLKI
jgi:hypothetical protein